MTKRYLGNIITQNPTAPAGDLANSSAKGVWSLEEQLAYQKAGLWPVPGNFPVDVEDVFSTYLYSGNSSAQTITNGIDLAGEGGLWWLKVRSQTGSNALYDSTRATGSEHFPLFSNNTNAEYDDFDTTPTSTGFTINSTSSGTVNETGQDYASWTFRKAPKFFDVVSWTGDGTHPRTFNHSLNCSIGFMATKETNASGNWTSFHRGLANGFGTGRVYLNANSSVQNESLEFLTSNNSSFTLTSDTGLNSNGVNYVAYLFAHNDGDGGFGPDGDADIIKCGTCSGETGSNRDIDLGFEPQFIITKAVDTTGDWRIVDNMRGFLASGTGVRLVANTSNAEASDDTIHVRSTGFYVNGLPGSGNYIYIAIRRGPMAVPESATDVFAMDFRFSSEAQALNPEHQYYSGFPVDMHLNLRRSGGGVYAYSRLQGGSNFLRTSTTDAEVSSTTNQFGSNEGLYPLGSTNTEDTTTLGHMFRRAPNFFDVVAWEGDGTTDKAVNHNLTVPPEMIWFKNRDDGTESWYVPFYGVSGITDGNAGLLNGINTIGGRNMSTQSPTSDTVYFGGTFGIGNTSGDSYIAYLFASLDGVSKIGTYTGNGSSQTIDCGFSSGARFILVKRVNFSTGDWYIWDTERGIVAGNDPHLSLNSTAAEVTTDDSIDPVSSGFAVNQVSATNINVSGSTYLFYAIA